MGSRPVTLRSSYPVVPGRYPSQLTDGDKPGRLGTASWGGRDSIPAQAGPALQSPLCFAVCETQIKWLSEKLEKQPGRQGSGLGRKKHFYWSVHQAQWSAWAPGRDAAPCCLQVMPSTAGAAAAPPACVHLKPSVRRPRPEVCALESPGSRGMWRVHIPSSSCGPVAGGLSCSLVTPQEKGRVSLTLTCQSICIPVPR